VLSQGQELGRYRVGAVLGTGAVGTVHAAVHTTLGTEHALKVLRLDDAEGRRRLLDEGRTQARLSHPNVVPVRDALQLADGRPVLVFDRVHGPTLRTLLRHAALPQDEAERLWLGVVEGVAHAHAHGVVHRDLKPANVLLDTRMTPSCPRVTDFGIARCLAVEGGTAPGQILGTPGYLAPEQLTDAASAGPAADVFSLGVLGVELLTGARPFAEVQGAAWLAAVAQADGQVVDGVPERWRTVLARCLRSRPQDRFPDAGALVDAIREPQPTPAPASSLDSRASPPPLPSLVLAGLAGLIGLAAGVAASSLASPVPQQPASDPSAELERDAWTRAADHPEQALALLRAAASLHDRTIPDSLVLDLVGRGAAVHVLPLPDSVPAVDARDGHVAAITTPGEVVLWDLDSGRQVSRFSTGVYQPRVLRLWPGAQGVLVDHHSMMGTSRTEAIAWDRQGRARVHAPGAQERLLVGERVLARIDDQLVAWDLDGNEVWRRGGMDGVRRLHAQTDSVVAVSPGAHVRLGLADGSMLEPLPVEPGVDLLGVSPDGRSAVRVDHDQVGWLDLSSGGSQPMAQAPGPAQFVAWAPDGRAACTWATGTSSVWLLQDQGTVLLDAHDRQGVQARFLDDGQIVTTSWDGQVRLWGERGHLLHVLGRHGGLVADLDVDGDTLVTGSLDRTVRLWARPDRLLGALRTRQGPALGGRARLVHRAGRGVLIGGQDGRVAHWSPAEDRVQVHDAGTHVVALDRGGQTLVGVRWDGTALVWSGSESLQVQSADRPVRVAVSPDGELFAVASRRRLELWSRHGEAIAAGPLTGFQVALAFSPDSDRLYVGHGEPGWVDVWQVEAVTPVATLRAELPGTRGISHLEAHEGGVVVGLYGGGAAGFDRQGERVWSQDWASDVVLIRIADGRILLGTRAGDVQLRELASGDALGQTHLEEMLTTALPRGGGALLGDVRGRLIDWRPGQEPRIRPAHRGPIAHLFADDGEIWTLGRDGLARAWDEAALATPVGGLESTGALSNLRVCRDSHRVVPVVPFPEPGTVWAPEQACEGAR